MIGDRNRRSPIITDPAEMLREINSLHLLCKDCGGKEDADMKVSLMFGAMMSATGLLQHPASCCDVCVDCHADGLSLSDEGLLCR